MQMFGFTKVKVDFFIFFSCQYGNKERSKVFYFKTLSPRV